MSDLNYHLIGDDMQAVVINMTSGQVISGVLGDIIGGD